MSRTPDHTEPAAATAEAAAQPDAASSPGDEVGADPLVAMDAEDADAPEASNVTGGFSVDAPAGVSILAEPVRPGVVGILTRIEQHGLATGVECNHIEMPDTLDATYGLSGRGEPSALALFLASLELDSTLGGATSLQVWAEDDRMLGFRAELLVADEAES